MHLVAVTTYRRPSDLLRLLDSLDIALKGFLNVQVIVADNDPAGSARDIVRDHPIGATYTLEIKPGIPAVRNRCLDVFERGQFETLSFVDDDMWVSPFWFRDMLKTSEQAENCVVAGAVVTHVPPDTPRWVKRGGYYRDNIHETGFLREEVGAGNVMITRRGWEQAGRCHFDQRFAASGGEDTDLFTRMRLSGVPLIACATAIASEDVTPERSTRKWRRERMVRNGIIGIMVAKKLGMPTLPVIVKGYFRILLRFLQCPKYILRGGGVGEPFKDAVFGQIGRLQALRGGGISQYRAE